MCIISSALLECWKHLVFDLGHFNASTGPFECTLQAVDGAHGVGVHVVVILQGLPGVAEGALRQLRQEAGCPNARPSARKPPPKPPRLSGRAWRRPRWGSQRHVGHRSHVRRSGVTFPRPGGGLSACVGCCRSWLNEMHLLLRLEWVPRWRVCSSSTGHVGGVNCAIRPECATIASLVFGCRAELFSDWVY